MDCRIRIEDAGDDAVVVVAEGELDAYVLPKLGNVFAKVAAADPQRLVVDLRRVTFMDSSALGAMVRSIRTFHARQAGLRVVLPHGPGRRIFEITTLDRVLPVSPSRASALAELSEDSAGLRPGVST